MNLKAYLKARLDRPGHPWLALYRRWRDRRRYAAAPTYRSPHGFIVHGDTSQVYGVKAGESRAGGELAIWQSLLAEAGAVVDVGANLGWFAMLAAQRGLPVLAVEPEPGNFASLLRNLADNNFTTVEPFALALGATAGVARLHGMGEMASLASDWGREQAVDSRLVAVNTLDHLLSGRFTGRRLLIKIDVEGHECSVLRGAVDTLGRHPAPSWLVEAMPCTPHGEARPDFIEVFRIFAEAGYSAWTACLPSQPIDSTQNSALAAPGAANGVNYVFRKE